MSPISTLSYPRPSAECLCEYPAPLCIVLSLFLIFFSLAIIFNLHKFIFHLLVIIFLFISFLLFRLSLLISSIILMIQFFQQKFNFLFIDHLHFLFKSLYQINYTTESFTNLLSVFLPFLPSSISSVTPTFLASSLSSVFSYLHGCRTNFWSRSDQLPKNRLLVPNSLITGYTSSSFNPFALIYALCSPRFICILLCCICCILVFGSLMFLSTYISGFESMIQLFKGSPFYGGKRS